MKSIASAAILSWAAASGCGGPRLVKVSGIVTIDGQPLGTGFVQVAPEGLRGASGKIDANGRFSLTTYQQDDGTYAGTHPVSVLGTESLGPGAQKWHAPRKYADLTTSGLRITVDKPTDDLKIELSWEGGKPFVEKFAKE